MELDHDTAPLYLAMKQVAAMLKFVSRDFDGETFELDDFDIYNAIEGARLIADSAITVTEKGA